MQFIFLCLLRARRRKFFFSIREHWLTCSVWIFNSEKREGERVSEIYVREKKKQVYVTCIDLHFRGLNITYPNISWYTQNKCIFSLHFLLSSFSCTRDEVWKTNGQSIHCRGYIHWIMEEINLIFYVCTFWQLNSGEFRIGKLSRQGDETYKFNFICRRFRARK